MLKVRAETAVGGDRCPLIAQHARLRLAKIHHRFDGDDHALTQLRAVTARSVIRHLRFFVQVRANAMSDKLAYYAKPAASTCSCTAAPTSPTVLPITA